MAKLYFYYGAMDAGKTTILVQSAHNYESRGLSTLVLKPEIDDRETNEPVIVNRTGLSRPAVIIPRSATQEDLTHLLLDAIREDPVSAVIIDESHFLTVDQIKWADFVSCVYDIPVLCYGLRTASTGEVFPSSAWLLGNAERLREVVTMCGCGSAASKVLRIVDGEPDFGGDLIHVGGNETYTSVCRKCYWLAKHNSIKRMYEYWQRNHAFRLAYRMDLLEDEPMPNVME